MTTKDATEAVALTAEQRYVETAPRYGPIAIGNAFCADYIAGNCTRNDHAAVRAYVFSRLVNEKELLDALEGVLPWADAYDPSEEEDASIERALQHEKAVDVARAAIAKAKGGAR